MPALTLLVVVIHGFKAAAPWPATGTQWPGLMAEEVLAADSREGLGVLTVDWEEGAAASIWSALDYDPPAANTRYVGVATERVVALLGGSALSVHCMGHSLGAHTCSFLSNAMEQDLGKKLERLTAMDPAGPQFTTDGPGSPSPFATTPAGERLEASDAVLVDVIHTDSDHLGTTVPLGHVDFYVGKSANKFGSDQAGCTLPTCDHSRSWELVRASLREPESCWGSVQCTGPDGAHSLGGCGQVTTRPQLGYFYQRSEANEGIFGVELTLTEDPFCFRCVDEHECDWGELCDFSIPAHQCVLDPSQSSTATSITTNPAQENCSSKLFHLQLS